MMNKHGLTSRLGWDLLRQAVYISIAVLVSMFVAGLLIEDVLIEQALEGEAGHYWNRVEKDPAASLPDTKNLTVYRDGVGLPPDLAGLSPGFYRQDEPREVIIHVSERGEDRIYLVFEAEQVDELVLLFGIVPLALALIVIYLSTYLAYRVSRRAVSPVVSLAERVQTLDPGSPNPADIRLDPEYAADDEIRVLAAALEDLVVRIREFAERERQFTRDASHELRTPLTVIKMAVERLAKDPGLDPSSRETLQRIRTNANDMESLTKAFLLLARETEQGLSREWVDVNEVVGIELERARTVASESQVKTRFEQENRLSVFAPEKIVESVVGNLLRNAVAYTDQGEVAVRITGNSVIIEDTGPGFDPDDVGKAEKLNAPQRRQRGGFGVGLTIVKRLTTRFRWNVVIDSEPGKGTRARVEFPESRTSKLT
jgi:signal transduction histidine kinase